MKLQTLVILFLANTVALAQEAVTVDETAHFLAGMPVTGALEPLTHNPAWQEHARVMDEAWQKNSNCKSRRSAIG